MAELKKVACEAIDGVASELNNISQELWKNPELNYKEHHAHTILTDFLDNQGFHVERKYKLDTAFRATFGDDSAGPHVAVLCEYDALPDIGHACGHNLIAELGVAAGVGIKAAMETSGKPIGKKHMTTILRYYSFLTGIITKGGVKANIIPEEAELQYSIRAPNKAELNVLLEKMSDCFESAAKATGCKVECKYSDVPYLNFIGNKELASTFETNAKELGLAFDEDGMCSEGIQASSDIGNVSYIVPSLHPVFHIGTDEVNHTRGYAEATGAAAAQPYTLRQGKAIAMTAVDVFINENLLQRIKIEFENEPQRKD
ncbi:peptidase M20 domain-containing protein 2-like [Pecten maximus]|uniref:peptidase M20 domain-containing protein 2-like n=1 Tax=Pecten maximus TaxID=6579 RepID=UPI0014587AF3|nr:peptidase M20 domain-containing protein 2-like [Pecten maximus]